MGRDDETSKASLMPKCSDSVLLLPGKKEGMQEGKNDQAHLMVNPKLGETASHYCLPCIRSHLICSSREEAG